MPYSPRRVRSLPATALRRLRTAAARTPLRVRLVTALLLLVAVALTASGVAATATLRSYLVGRVDSQLQGAQVPITEHGLAGVVQSPQSDHGGDSGDAGNPDRGQNNGGHDAGSQELPSNYVVEVTDSAGTVVYGPTSALVDSTQPLPELPHRTPSATGRHEHTFTVNAVNGGTQWRVLATPVTLTDGSAGTLLIAQSLGDAQNTLNHLTVLLAMIGAVTVFVVGGVGYLLVRRSMRPLVEVERSAARIAGGDLSHRVPARADPRTEVGGLSAALNTMLGQIETAFTERAASEEGARGSEQRMRRFVADASHELRTPLTTIRGFAELYRQGAVSDPSELDRVMRRIEDEAKRMGLLVDDLLTLARLDRQRPLEQVPVDMLAVAGDAVSAARAVDRDRRIDLVVEGADPPPVVIGDEPRLRQVLANLVSNALQHTPPGTPVVVRLGTRGAGDEHPAAVRIAVEDSGPGLGLHDAAKIFERFYRTDASRNRHEGGSGLGLSIVAALVAGHGGTVDVDTAPGEGARFVVELPLADNAAAEEPATQA